MKVLRTPDAAFKDLPEWPFAPRYTTITDDDGTPLRIHHVESGPADGAPVLLMHGNPSWSYLHRHMIGPLAATGRRVIAVDLVGCGRSDKPAERSDYTQARHVDWLSKWLLAMDLQHTSLYCQDWGGTLGLHLVARYPERFDRVMVSNSGLPQGEGANWFLALWTTCMRYAWSFPWFLFKKGFAKPISKATFAAYRAPFPTRALQAGILKFPLLIAVQKDNPGAAENRQAWAALAGFDKPFVTVFGGLDPVAKKIDRRMQRHIPGARGQAHHVVPDAAHFIQEDATAELLERLVAFLDQPTNTAPATSATPPAP